MNTSYHEALSSLGVSVIVDNGTERDDEAVRLLLLHSGGRFGFLIIGSIYDPSYAPAWCLPGYLSRLKLQLMERTRWWNTAQEVYDFFRLQGNGFWTAHRVGRDDPMLVNGFLLDVGNLLRERYEVI